jgi:hypothetical protein
MGLVLSPITFVHRIVCAQDFMDVVFGWMLSLDTDESNVQFCVNILPVMADFFKRDMSFTASMLSQLFDDFTEVSSRTRTQENDIPETEKLLRLVA